MEVASNSIRKLPLLRILIDWSKEATGMKLENEINLAKQKWRQEAQASISIRVIKKQDREFGVQY